MRQAVLSSTAGGCLCTTMHCVVSGHTYPRQAPGLSHFCGGMLKGRWLRDSCQLGDCCSACIFTDRSHPALHCLQDWAITGATWCLFVPFLAAVVGLHNRWCGSTLFWCNPTWRGSGLYGLGRELATLTASVEFETERNYGLARDCGEGWLVHTQLLLVLVEGGSVGCCFGNCQLHVEVVNLHLHPEAMVTWKQVS